MNVWLTKHALTKGISETEVVYSFDPRYVRNNNFTFMLGRDAHITLEAAKAKAEAMRLAKIKSLHKQIENLEKINFEKDSK